MEFKTIRLNPRTLTLKYEGDGNNYRYEFQGSDRNIYTISGFEEKSYPDFIATEMLAANSNLELVVRG